MSDNSTGSSGSSTNSWTLLSPEEADIAGAGDDGTESIGDVPSLSEEVAGSCLEVKPSDDDAPPQETILSEEGHQVCQETSPELFDEGAVSGPSAEADPEICAPVIHATITTSPPDSDLLGAVPFSISTESSVFLSQEPFLETSYEEALFNLQPVFDFSPKECVVAEATPEHVDKVAPVSEPVAEIGPVSEAVHEFAPASEPKAEIAPPSKLVDELGPALEHKTETTPAIEHEAEIAPPSEPVAEIEHVSEPVGEITPAPEPVGEITPATEPKAEITPAPEPVDEIRLVSEPKAEITPASEPIVEISPFPGPPDITLGSERSRTSAVPVFGVDEWMSSCPESSSPRPSSQINFSSAAEGLYPETPASSVLEEKELVSEREGQKTVLVSREAESLGTNVPLESQGEGSGLRQRRVHYPQELRQSSDEDDEEEFKLPDRKEERPGFAMSYLIIGALALLCLGSLFFSGSVLDQAGDDFDGSELSDQELLEKLMEENKQISILEKQIQAQRDELDRALRAAAEKPVSEEEHARMKEELSALPSLKEELEALKVRISELTQLTGNELSEPSPGPDRRRGRQDELTRQKTLLEQSRTRLEGMKKQDRPKKWLRERLVEMQQRLSEQVDRIGRKDEWRRKHKGGDARKNEWGDSVQKRKELLKMYRDDWVHKKSERKLERETRKQERSWQARPGHKHKHDHKVHQESKDFWKLQEKKLRSSRNPPEHCHDVSSCAEVQGLVRVKLPDFQDLLDVYLNKLQVLTEEHKQAFHHLVAQFFPDGVFSHDRMLFSEFVEDVADVLEDLVDVLLDDDVLEEEMEEFEREALLKFAV